MTLLYRQSRSGAALIMHEDKGVLVLLYLPTCTVVARFLFATRGSRRNTVIVKNKEKRETSCVGCPRHSDSGSDSLLASRHHFFTSFLLAK